MNYSIPANPQEISELKQRPVNTEMIAVAIAGVVNIARSKGQSLEDLTAEVLEEDKLLDPESRRWLSDVVSQAWLTLP
jgi:ferritin-like protein